jgi:alpha-L-fucosidase
VAPYRDGKFRYTRMKNGDVYAIYLPDADEQRLPARLEIPGPSPRAGSRLAVLGSDVQLEWRREGERTIAVIPEAAREATAGSPAWAIRLPGATGRMR